MSLLRRDFLANTGAGMVAGLLATSPSQSAHAAGAASPKGAPAPGDWGAVRGLFDLSPDYVYLTGLLLSSHPRPVREAIDAHRRGLDANPALYMHDHEHPDENIARQRAAEYLAVQPGEIALTDSTTMGVGLLYGGLNVRPDQEIVTTTHDHFVTHETLRLRQVRSGTAVRKIKLYDDPARVTEDQIAAAVQRGIGPKTRALAVTWVHSCTGVKLPIRRIASVVAAANANRAEADRVLLCVDGVHGFGCEDFTLPQLGCDFFAAGCHKWLFGPRGTGLLWGRADAWRAYTPLFASFSSTEAWLSWAEGRAAGTLVPGEVVTPGGNHSFEHRWALAAAFDLHKSLGKARVAARMQELCHQLKEGLAAMKHVTLYTPRSAALSAGLVCFDVRNLKPAQVVAALQAKKIVASVTPYLPSYARLTPAVFNTPAEIDTALAAIKALA